MTALKASLPWTTPPLILNAPMAGTAGGRLAASVTLAGGLGMIGSTSNLSTTRAELELARSALAEGSFTATTTEEILPIGLGFLAFLTPLAAAAELGLVALAAPRAGDQEQESVQRVVAVDGARHVP